MGDFLRHPPVACRSSIAAASFGFWIRDDRGRDRKRSALPVLNSMNFAAQVLSLSVLQENLATPLIKNLREGDEWSRRQEAEAIPLPLFVLRNLEAALLKNGEDTLCLAALLLMLWARLRFSDIQRIDLGSVVAVDNSIRGFCWRTKSRKRGMPWACLRCGILGRDWAGAVVAEASTASECSSKQDYFLPRYSKPMTYTTALANFRRCIVVHGQAHLFALHSLKATVLYWANLLAVSEVERAAQSHHKSALVPKFSSSNQVPAACDTSIGEWLGASCAIEARAGRAAHRVVKKILLRQMTS